MKTERRHELARNELADLIGDKIEALKPYSTALTATALAVVVAVFAFVLWSRKSEARRAKGWQEYFTASQSVKEGDDDLLKVIDDYPHTSAALWARVSIADRQLAKGIDQLFNDRSLARQSLDDAVEGFRTALDEASDDQILSERATFGLAEAYEAKNDLSQAREQYQAVIDRWPGGAFAGMAGDRLSDLERRGTKDFYDWFAKHSPPPKTPKGPGVPGERPAFDTNLPDDLFTPGIDLHGSGSKTKTKSGTSSGTKEKADPIGSLLDREHVRPETSKPRRDAEAKDDDSSASDTADDEPAGNAATDTNDSSTAPPTTDIPPADRDALDSSGAGSPDPASSLGGKPK